MLPENSRSPTCIPEATRIVGLLLLAAITMPSVGADERSRPLPLDPSQPGTADSKLPTAAASRTTPVEISSVVVSAIEQVEISARIAAPLIRVIAEEGQEVRKGDVLAELDAQDAKLLQRRRQIEFQSARERAESLVEIELAKTDLKLAKSDMVRAQKSRQIYTKAITDEEIEHRQLVIDQAQLKVQQAEQNREHLQREASLAEVALELAAADLQRFLILAPMDGILVDVRHRVGEWLEPGKPVARIVRVDRLRAEGFVDGSQQSHLKRGQPVVLNCAGTTDSPSRQFNGVLKFVSPEIVAVDGRVRIWAEINNNDLQLRPGTRASLLVMP